MAALTSTAIPFTRLARGPLAEVLPEVVPHWADYADALEKCSAQAAGLAEISRAAVPDMVSSLANQLLDGKPLPDDFAGATTAQLRAQEEATQAGRILDQVQNQLVQQRDEEVRAAGPAILHGLNDRLLSAVEAARKLKLRDAWDAEDAIDKGVAADWAEFSRLRGEHFQLREAQQRVMSNLNLGVTHLTTFAYFADYAADFPDWHRWRADGLPTRTLQPAGTDTVVVLAPWPDDLTVRFRWLVDHPDIAVWIPDSEQLAQAVARAQQSQRPETEAERRARVDQAEAGRRAELVVQAKLERAARRAG